MKFTRVARQMVLPAFCGVLLWGQQQDRPKGIHLKDKPEDYSVRTQSSGLTIAATLVPPDQVKRLFAFDISKNYVVLEVACYPGSNISASLQADDFVIKTGDKGDLAYNSDPQTVALVIQGKNIPKPASQTLHVGGNVGYQSGIDPYTGRRVSGVYGGGGVGVDNHPVPQAPTPGGYPEDRAVLEGQLWNKSLPEGALNSPVAGYLYFPVSQLKKKSNNGYLLQYSNPDSARMELLVPFNKK